MSLYTTSSSCSRHSCSTISTLHHLTANARHSRKFTTTAPNNRLAAKPKLRQMFKTVPAYPYPIKHTYKQSWFGLYGGKHIQFGNNIPEEERTITRRDWKPNVQVKNLDTHAGRVTVRLTTSVLRTIRKAGGLGKYLLGEKPARLKELGPEGWAMRWRMLTTPEMRERHKKERKRMGMAGEMRINKVKNAVGRTANVYRLPTNEELMVEWEKGKRDGSWKSLLPQAINRPKGHVDEIKMVGAVGKDGVEETSEVLSESETVKIPVDDDSSLEKQAVELEGSEGIKEDDTPGDILVNKDKPVMPKSGDIKIL